MALFGKKTKIVKAVEETKTNKAGLSLGTDTHGKLDQLNTDLGKNEVGEKKATQTSASTGRTSARDFTHILKRPRITEKATFAAERGVYVFEIEPRATKHDVMRAVEEFYKVKPVKVNITQILSKKVSTRRRGVFGRKGGGKKAYVYLKKGDTISIV